MKRRLLYRLSRLRYHLWAWVVLCPQCRAPRHRCICEEMKSWPNCKRCGSITTPGNEDCCGDCGEDIRKAEAAGVTLPYRSARNFSK